MCKNDGVAHPHAVISKQLYIGTMLKRKFLLTAFAFASYVPTTVHAAFEACRDYFPTTEIPKINHRDRLRDICFDSFAILHSGQTKTPVYVVERLSRARLNEAKKKKRTDRFYEEARLPIADRATLADYRGSGYDRGHMAPAGDMPNVNAMAQSFSLANTVPQSRKNNQGIWARSVETATRRYVQQRANSEVYVFTGPVFKGTVEKIGAGNVWIPTHLFKLIYDSGSNRAWAYLVENKDEAEIKSTISYQMLVKQIGIELLPGISPKN